MQGTVRSPTLDSYFAMTANLGTHTFFMTALPICFWCGHTILGRALVHMLALGVFWSGFIKDLVCIPRPLSPPLTRITMSKSAALEYGFPSTHSTNAVSVAAYCLYSVHAGQTNLDGHLYTLALVAGYWYAISIVFGRLYCGMHGFFDVFIGSALGIFLAAIQITFGPMFDIWIAEGSLSNLLITVGAILLSVRFHPEPADNCPCFDDSVAFAGVVMGIELGHWSFSKSPISWTQPGPATVPFDLHELGWIKTILRILVGVLIVFLWRAVMKPTLLRALPPLFRFIENVGLSLPRRFFTRASQYQQVPTLRKDDNVIPQFKEIPAFLTSLRHPRKRAVSVGPQSEADAREMIHHRDQVRRESQNTERPTFIRQSSLLGLPSPLEDAETETYQLGATRKHRYEGPLQIPGAAAGYELLTPPLSDAASDAASDAEMFLALEKPRVRYDVEVVTKLVVYAGKMHRYDLTIKMLAD
ncbi:hypothetical protein MBLNU457_5379t2 [Dothideomycetes sp. NU457]